ncbi:MAG: hypothetical protein RIQ59_394 [Bacteroidota bacterium]|jgi:hypothetical protein
MKNLLKKIALLSIVMLVFGCSKDSPTPNAVPCTPIPCLNGGISTPNCGCNCPQGFTGSNCGTQITPLQVLITKIRVTKFPDTNAGGWWDTLPNSDADIYVTIQNSSSTTLYNSPTFFQDATSNGVNYYDFVPSTPIVITNVANGYVMSIYDYDTIGSDELMDFSTFYLYNSTGGFPTTKTYTNSTGTFSFTLTLSYVW